MHTLLHAHMHIDKAYICVSMRFIFIDVLLQIYTYTYVSIFFIQIVYFLDMLLLIYIVLEIFSEVVKICCKTAFRLEEIH